MATDAAKLLDELMGRDRNLAPTEKRREIRWEDPDVCKFLLCGFCPHDLFVNTRADLGTCEKVHDDELRKAYQKSSRYEKMGYEEDFLRFLQDLLSDVERRIKKGQSRLALNNAQASLSAGPHAQREEKIQMLTEKINELVQQAEELGCEGNVEQAQGVLKLCEKLKEERTQLENINAHTFGPNNEQKEMEVCEVCGALLVVNDVQQRVNEHIMGKQHMGYAQIRSTVDDIRERRQRKLRGETDAEREARLNKEREERIKEREEKEKEREKEREERRKKRKEEEEKRKKRSRSRSRSKRSRSRDRKKRSRSRDRRRSRSRDRHSRRRSRSRDRHRSKHSHRSRSRDRKSRERRSSRDRERSSRDKKSSRDKDRSSRDKDRSSRNRDKSSRDREDKKKEAKKTEEDTKKSEEDIEGEKKMIEGSPEKLEEGQVVEDTPEQPERDVPEGMEVLDEADEQDTEIPEDQHQSEHFPREHPQYEEGEREEGEAYPEEN